MTRNFTKVRWPQIIFLIIMVLILPAIAAAQADSTRTAPVGVPVIFDGDTLFYVLSGIETFPPAERAQIIEQRLGRLYKQNKAKLEISIIDSNQISQIFVDSTVVVNVTDDDAVAAGSSRPELASRYAESIKKSLQAFRETRSKRQIIIDLAITVSMFIISIFLFWLMTKAFRWIYIKLESWEGKIFRPVKFRSIMIVSAENITSLFLLIAKGVRFFISLAIIYILAIRLFYIIPWTQNWDVKPVIGGILLTVLVTVALVMTVRWLNSIYKILLDKIPQWKGTLIKPVRLKNVVLFSEDRLIELLTLVARLPRLILMIMLIYFYVTIVFSFFEFSQTWAATLVGYLLKPLGIILESFLNFLPNFFYIVVVIFVTRFLLKLIRLIFTEIDKGKLEIPGFYPEWAKTTYKIVRFLVIAFAVIVIFPYLPGSDSPFFRGISIFLGVLFSLGSSSAIANVIAGIVLTYMRPFKIGDRVKIADTIGDVIERTLLVTRVRTIKNVDITITNSMVLGSHMINYSSSSHQKGLILHTTVTIGYDAPWRKVHELLIFSAKETENILETPPPFVLQTALNDFYVSYELNAYTNEASKMALTYSNLHQNIQDKFYKAGIEIMSPHYEALRDGNSLAIPKDQLPEDYKAPGFRIDNTDIQENK